MVIAYSRRTSGFSAIYTALDIHVQKGRIRAFHTEYDTKGARFIITTNRDKTYSFDIPGAWAFIQGMMSQLNCDHS